MPSLLFSCPNVEAYLDSRPLMACDYWLATPAASRRRADHVDGLLWHGSDVRLLQTRDLPELLELPAALVGAQCDDADDDYDSWVAMQC
jgi:hypothetical protein